MEIPFNEALEQLLKIPEYCSSKRIALAKVTTRDGHPAVIRMEIVTGEDDIEDSIIWVPPNVELTRLA